MTKHRVGTREEWRTARLDLLKAEKEFCCGAIVRRQPRPAMCDPAD